MNIMVERTGTGVGEQLLKYQKNSDLITSRNDLESNGESTTNLRKDKSRRLTFLNHSKSKNIPAFIRRSTKKINREETMNICSPKVRRTKETDVSVAEEKKEQYKSNINKQYFHKKSNHPIFNCEKTARDLSNSKFQRSK